jgi:hypothetical protein
MGRAGLREARRVAILSSQRSPTTKIYIRDDDDQAGLLSYHDAGEVNGSPTEAGAWPEER